MTREEKYIARLLFKNKVYESDKQAYEDFFVRVMQNANPNLFTGKFRESINTDISPQ